MGIHRKILFLTGSPNQTSQMMQIAAALPEYDCRFSQVFTDAPLLRFLAEHTNLVDKTIIAKPFRQKAEALLRQEGRRIDYRALDGIYDLVVFCSDLIVPHRMRKTRTLWVQEGMIDKYTVLSRLVQKLNLPPHLCFNTSLNGSTNACDLYCAASEGYKNYISGLGTERDKILVTGIPNYDHVAQYRDNDFPYRDYVMVATTDMRETARVENRPRFIRETVAIAQGRPMLFKLHPNEKKERAIKEIRKYAPADALIFQEGNTHHMIANCSELITQYSTVVYTGIALGKKVHSWFDLDTLKRQVPIQNQGTSALNIAQVCRDFLLFIGPKSDFKTQYSYHPVALPQYELAAAGNL